MTVLERIRRQQLLVITGKGGVGKTTVAATLGRILATKGDRVLLLEVDPRESLHELFDVPPSGGEVVEIEPGLYLQNVDPRAVLDELVRDHLRLELIAGRIIASPVYQHFAEGAPGLKELAVLQHALRMLSGESRVPEVTRVIIDAPATGHGVSMLAAPRVVSEVIRDGPVGKLAGELADATRDPDRFGVVVTTLAEEMPVQETIELARSLKKRLSLSPELLVINELYPPLDDTSPADEPSGDGPIALWHRRRRINDRELERLAGAWKGPRVELPLLPLSRSPELVAALSVPLEAGLGRREQRR